MTCATCGASAAPGQKFCGECGSALSRSCASCGAAVASGQRFCGECGAAQDAVVATPAPRHAGGPGATGDGPVAERRLVSVVFVDLVGFTPFSEGHDAEEVRDTLSRYFDLASEVIGRYGGTVEKFIGDAVMAVWGTPIAREDDAERAVRAALELVATVPDLGPGIQARSGVLTGEAAVTLGATNQGMVAGDLVNTASRLQSVAPPETVLVDDATYRAASRAIIFESAGEQTLKGKVAPVPAWRAVRVVAERGGRGRTESLEAPFVGRDAELRLLKELYHATSADHRVRLASILGIGGIGKSRLAWEFEKYLDGIVSDVWWHEGRSPAYGEGVTFWALSEMVRARARLNDTDDEGATRTAIGALLDIHLADDDADRRWVESALLELLGIRTGMPSDELFSAWRTFFERLAATGPVVLVFQDLHWADPGTLDFIDHLLEWSRGAAIFIVTLARPELLEKRPDWGAGQRSFTSLHLGPLPDAAMEELLGGLVPGLPTEAVRAIVTRAEGVPLYAVETLRMLVASGQLVADEHGTLQPHGDLTELAVPETLTALIAARLDSLDPADRALLLDAAVLGQSFAPAGLAAVAGVETAELERRLRSLVRREVLTHIADARSPERGQYAFVQALIREVAYHTLAKRDRKIRHLAAARWFESLGEDELAGALAGHYLAARENAADGAESDALAAQARLALRAAAERAAALGSHQQAVSFYASAIGVTTDPTEIAELSMRAGVSAGTWGNYEAAEEHFGRAADGYRAIGDRSSAARVIGSLGGVLLSGRRIDRAMALLDAGAAEAADLGDDPGRLLIASQSARGYFLMADNERSFALAESILPAAERLDLLPIIADTLVTKGSAMANLGRWREGLGILETGARVAEGAGLSAVVLRARNNVLAYSTEVDPHEAAEAARSAIAIARRTGERASITGFIGNLGFVAMRTGEWETAIGDLRAALLDTEDALDRVLLVNNLANLLIVRGEPFAGELAELEQTAAAAPDDRQVQSFVQETKAWVALARGDLSGSRSLWREQFDADPTTGTAAIAWVARLGLWLGDGDGAVTSDVETYYRYSPHGGAVDATQTALRAGVAAGRGDRPAALAGFRESAEAFRALRLPLDRALIAIDMLASLGPDDASAREAAEEARATFRGLGAAPLLAILESFASGDRRPERRGVTEAIGASVSAAGTGAPLTPG